MSDENAHSLLDGTPPAHPSDAQYRELAQKIRELASQTKLTAARRELFWPAANYERGGNHLHQRTPDSHPIFASFP